MMGRALKALLSCMASGAVAVGITLYAMAPAGASAEGSSADTAAGRRHRDLTRPG
jgi:hypothetical protein